MTTRRPIALTVAGTDSSGGAGVVADVRTFAAHGVWAAVAVTAVTAQNAAGVGGIALIEPALVQAQMRSVADVRAVKTGMLGTAATVEAVADALPACPLVVDPVIVSTSGTPLLDAAGVDALRRRLLPAAAVVTPNLAEAAALTGGAVGSRREMEQAALALLRLGCRAVLVTGGHLDDGTAADCLLGGAGAPVWLEGTRLAGSAHGTGCVLSAAIAAGLALGDVVEDACRHAKDFVTRALERAGPAGADPA